jgi:hypothetical protein
VRGRSPSGGATGTTTRRIGAVSGRPASRRTPEREIAQIVRPAGALQRGMTIRLRPSAFALFTVCAMLSRLAHAQHPEPQLTRAEQLRQAEVVVVKGSADHMEQVMERAKVKFVVVSPEELPQLPLHGQQVLMVNCTGEMSDAARERVRRFVTAGGFLYTTDHAVHYLLEPTFPGLLRYSGKTSEEAIFPMDIAVGSDRGLLNKINASGHPRWQLAGGGFLFDVLDQSRVEILMRSSAVAKRYRNDGILGVRFRVGDGQVIHVTGHFYTQPGQRPEVAAAGRAFEQLSTNVVDEKTADRPRLQGMYKVAPKRAMVMKAAPAPAAPSVATPSGKGEASTSATTKVKVLGTKGTYANVRDAEGNEGWVDTDSLDLPDAPQ